MRKPNSNRLKKFTVLHRFFTESVWDEQEQRLLFQREIEELIPWDSMKNSRDFSKIKENDRYDYQYESNGPDIDDVKALAPIFNNMVACYGEQYKHIWLNCEEEGDGYRWNYYIVGVNEETDEEYNARILKEEAAIRQEKKERAEKAEQRRLKKIEEAKKILAKAGNPA